MNKKQKNCYLKSNLLDISTLIRYNIVGVFFVVKNFGNHRDLGKISFFFHIRYASDKREFGGDKMPHTDAYIKAMALLAISYMSERKLREKLAAKGFSSEDIAEATNELRSQGYISDDRLIENLVNYYAKKKYYGRYRIRLELLSKFDRKSVDRSFDCACELIDFKAVASEIAIKEAAKGVEREKLIRKLQRLGHDTVSIRGALSEIADPDK